MGLNSGTHMAFLNDLNYIVSSIWRDESNRYERLRRLLLFVDGSCGNGRLGPHHSQPLQWPSFYRLSRLRRVRWIYLPAYSRLSRHFIYPPSSTRWRAGGCWGQRRIYKPAFGRPGRPCISLRAQPDSCESCRENLRLNDSHFEVYEVALSDVCQDLELEDAGA